MANLEPYVWAQGSKVPLKYGLPSSKTPHDPRFKVRPHTMEPWAHRLMGNFGTLRPYFRRNIGTLDPYIQGNFGTLSLCIQGNLIWNPGPIHLWGTLEPWAHTSGGTLGPWAYVFKGTLEPWAHTFVGNFGTLGPYFRGNFEPWAYVFKVTLEPWAPTFVGNFGILGPYIQGEPWSLEDDVQFTSTSTATCCCNTQIVEYLRSIIVASELFTYLSLPYSHSIFQQTIHHLYEEQPSSSDVATTSSLSSPAPSLRKCKHISSDSDHKCNKIITEPSSSIPRQGKGKHKETASKLPCTSSSEHKVSKPSLLMRMK